MKTSTASQSIEPARTVTLTGAATSLLPKHSADVQRCCSVLLQHCWRWCHVLGRRWRLLAVGSHRRGWDCSPLASCRPGRVRSALCLRQQRGPNVAGNALDCRAIGTILGSTAYCSYDTRRATTLKRMATAAAGNCSDSANRTEREGRNTS